MTFFARALLVLAAVAGTAPADDPAGGERARVQSLFEQGAFVAAEALARTLLASAPDSSAAQVDAQLLVLRTARRARSLSPDALVAFAEDLLARQRAVLPDDHPQIAEAWHELGNTHVRRGRQDEAATAFGEAYARRRATLGDDATDTIRSALGLANALQWTRREDDARTLYREQIARLEANPTGREERLVFALNGFGFLQRRTGDRVDAIASFRRAAEIAAQAMPELHLTRALVERNLGVTLAVDAPELAVDHLRRALHIRQELLPARDVLIGRLALDLADVDVRLGRYGAADEHYALGIACLAERARDHDAVRDAWIGRANAGIQRSDFDGARAAIDSAAARGADETVILSLRANRANAMGDFELAVELYDQALRRREQDEGRDSAGFARLLHNRAEVLTAQGRAAAALASRREAVAIQESVLAADDPDLALGRLNLAVSLLDAGEADAALARLDAVAPIVDSSFATTHPARANLRLLRARARAATHGADAGVAPAREAVALRRDAYGDDHLEVAWALDELAGHELAAGRVDEATPHAREADATARASFRDVLLTLPERQALAFVGAGRTGRDVLIEAARRFPDPRRVREAFDATIRGRALVLDALLERRRAATSTDTAVTRAREELDHARRDLVAAATRGDADAARWMRLRARREGAEARLATLSAAERRRLDREDRGLDHVFDALEPDEALVAFVHLDETDRMVAFVARGASVDLVDLGAASSLDTRVVAWLDAVRAPIDQLDVDASVLLDDVRRAARALGARLIDPLETPLDGAERIWWVPDGALHRVQPAALVDRTGRFLAEGSWVFAHLSAERDLDVGRRAQVSARVLALGDPDFGPTTESSPPCPDLESLRFAPLPATRTEIEAVPAMTRVRGADAREDRLPGLLPGHDTLHLATHGFFLPEECTPSAGDALRGLRGIGTVVRRGTARARRAPTLGPLLRSGLVLAGANTRATATDPAGDGLLLAEEIAGLDLADVHTVVLSACDTGVGRIVSGEGVLGLPRAFRQAGARQVVMSLWPVQDDATQRWMTAFYRARAAGVDVATAAHAARRSMIEADPAAHPFFWAAFVAIGPER